MTTNGVSSVMGRVLPPKPCRRMLVFALLWSCLFFLIYRVYTKEDLLQSGAANSMNTRELLQKEIQGPSGKAATPSSLLSASTTTVTPQPLADLYIASPLVDKSPAKGEKQLLTDLQGKLPNLPLAYLHEVKNKNLGFNKTCAKYPAIYDIHISNVYWQEQATSNGTFYLYGAYLDVRKTNRLGPTIRILGMIDRLEPTIKTHCQIWFNGTQAPVISRVLEYKYIWYKKWGNYKPGIFQPYLLACQLPKTHWKSVPISVSIVENICDTATNNLRVIYNKLEDDAVSKTPFAVCVKGLDFPDEDISVRMVEWLETLSALGANKVFLYELETHPNVTKVLEYYVEQGLVDLTPITLPGYQPNMPFLQHLYLKSKTNNKRQNELIPYNDCLYRNMYQYEYIALLDIDEVIMPIDDDNWSDLMRHVIEASLKVKNDSRASYNFRNVYFMDEMLEGHMQSNGGEETSALLSGIPPYMHMMRHVYRSANYTKPGQYVKCFHNPEKALVLHNHFPLACLGGVCTSYPVETNLAHLQHYRRDCVSPLRKSCDNYKNVSVLDTTIWKHKERIITRSTDTLAKLGFFRTNSASGSASLQ